VASLHGGALLCQRVELVWWELTVTPEGSAVTNVLIQGIGWPLSDGTTGWPRASERLGAGRREPRGRHHPKTGRSSAL
jgi:hypothetical protein